LTGKWAVVILRAVVVILFVRSDIPEIKKVVWRNIERVLKLLIDKEGKEETLGWFEEVVEEEIERLI